METYPKTEKESVKVLRQCIDLQLRKSQDYQNPNSNVKQAMHYRRGVDSIHDIIQGKVYRAQSLLESDRADSQNFESLEDTYMDIINYCSFAVSYIRGQMEGQDPTRGMFNRPKKATVQGAVGAEPNSGLIHPYGPVGGTAALQPIGNVTYNPATGYHTIEPLNTKLDGRNEPMNAFGAPYFGVPPKTEGAK